MRFMCLVRSGICVRGLGNAASVIRQKEQGPSKDEKTSSVQRDCVEWEMNSPLYIGQLCRLKAAEKYV